MANIIMVRPGETVSIVGVPAEVPPIDPNAPRPTHPIMLPGMPGWGVGQPPTSPVDPGYGVDVGSGPVRPSHPIWYPTPGPGQPPGSHPPTEIGGGPILPSVPPTPEHPWVPPSGPVDPGYFPPGVVAPPNAPDGGGNWCWAWLPGVGWRWVRIPGSGEAGPK
jgi:hypothetical protein